MTRSTTTPQARNQASARGQNAAQLRPASSARTSVRPGGCSRRWRCGGRRSRCAGGAVGRRWWRLGRGCGGPRRAGSCRASWRRRGPAPRWGGVDSSRRVDRGRVGHSPLSGHDHETLDPGQRRPARPPHPRRRLARRRYGTRVVQSTGRVVAAVGDPGRPPRLDTTGGKDASERSPSSAVSRPGWHRIGPSWMAR